MTGLPLPQAAVFALELALRIPALVICVAAALGGLAALPLRQPSVLPEKVLQRVGPAILGVHANFHGGLLGLRLRHMTCAGVFRRLAHSPEQAQQRLERRLCLARPAALLAQGLHHEARLRGQRGLRMRTPAPPHCAVPQA